MHVCVYYVGYIRTTSYSIGDMEERERTIRENAEKTVAATLGMPKRWFFQWILFHARRGVKNRENLRFSRTKLYGIFRDLFRAIGSNLVRLGLLNDRQVGLLIPSSIHVKTVSHTYIRMIEHDEVNLNSLLISSQANLQFMVPLDYIH